MPPGPGVGRKTSASTRCRIRTDHVGRPAARSTGPLGHPGPGKHAFSMALAGPPTQREARSSYWQPYQQTSQVHPGPGTRAFWMALAGPPTQQEALSSYSQPYQQTNQVLGQPGQHPCQKADPFTEVQGPLGASLGQTMPCSIAGMPNSRPSWQAHHEVQKAPLGRPDNAIAARADTVSGTPAWANRAMAPPPQARLWGVKGPRVLLWTSYRAPLVGRPSPHRHRPQAPRPCKCHGGQTAQGCAKNTLQDCPRRSAQAPMCRQSRRPACEQ